ncbi:hypothetical protein Bca101_025811 [Brassica carinata]
MILLLEAESIFRIISGLLLVTTAWRLKVFSELYPEQSNTHKSPTKRSTKGDKKIAA